MKKILTLFAFLCIWFLSAQDTFVKDNFTKKEVYVTMRDGVKLWFNSQK